MCLYRKFWPAFFLVVACTALTRLEAPPEFAAPTGCPSTIIDRLSQRPTEFPWLKLCEADCRSAKTPQTWVSCCFNRLVPERMSCATYCQRGNSGCFAQCSDNLFCTTMLAAQCVGVTKEESPLRDGTCSIWIPVPPAKLKAALKLECQPPPSAARYRVDLRWEQTVHAQGYTVEVSPEDVEDFHIIAKNIQTPQFSHRVFEGNYQYRIIALNEAGESAPSTPIIVRAKESVKNHCVHPSIMIQ